MDTKGNSLGQHIIKSLSQHTLNLLHPLAYLSLNTLVLILHQFADIRQHLGKEGKPLLAELLSERLLGLQGDKASESVITTSRLGVGGGRRSEVLHQRVVELLVVVGGVSSDGEVCDGGDHLFDHQLSSLRGSCVSQLGNKGTRNAGEVGRRLPEFCR